MSFASLLIDVGTVQRNTPGVQDAYGQPTPSWAAHLTDEPCRLMAHSGKEIQIGAEVVVANYTLFIGDVDITEQDRVIIDSVTYEILLVEDKQDGIDSHHKECEMQAVR